MPKLSAVNDRPTHSIIAAVFLCGCLFPVTAYTQAVTSPSAKPSAAIPATSPTQLLQEPARPAESPIQRAIITFADNKLTVATNNSSLNQILRDIAAQTYLVITGSVMDERVFGTYGPAPLAEIIPQLLDGIRSNMLYKEATASAPAELILTRRSGEPTPASAVAAATAADAAANPPDPYPTTTNDASPAPENPPVNNAAPASSQPSGPRTPEQIMQELQRLRQQAEKPQTPQ